MSEATIVELSREVVRLRAALAEMREPLKTHGEIKVSYDSRMGEYVGLTKDIIQAIADRTGLTVVGVHNGRELIAQPNQKPNDGQNLLDRLAEYENTIKAIRALV